MINNTCLLLVGYSQQQMMPPPMHGGTAGQMGYPGKMGSHPNMMNNPAMGSQPYNNQYPNQGRKIHRQEKEYMYMYFRYIDIHKILPFLSDQIINDLCWN